MAYCSGDMREHVKVLWSTRTDAGGFAKFTYTAETESRAAQVKSVSGKDFASALAAGTQDVITFTVRWIEGLTTADRIEWEGTAYNILEVNLLGARRDYMSLKCRIAPK